MFCQKCGANLPDGSTFCQVCGSQLNVAPATPVMPAAPAAPVAPAGYDLPVAPQPPKKKKTGMIIAIVVAVIVVIAGVVGALFATGVIGKSDEERIQEIAEDTANKISRGTVNGNVYTNDSIGISFEKPADWKFATDDELGALVGGVMDEIDREDVEKALIEASMVYDMMTSSEAGDSVQVYFINLQDSNGDINEAIEDAKEGMNSGIKNSLGVDMTFSDTTEATLCGKKFKAFTGSVDYGYGVMKIKMFIKINDNNIATVIGISSTGFGYDLAEIEAMFK